MNTEQLMSVLIAPHVTEKTSLAMQNHNQYTFRVRRDQHAHQLLAVLCRRSSISFTAPTVISTLS